MLCFLNSMLLAVAIEAKGLTANYERMINLIVSVAFSLVAITGSAYIGWLGFKSAKAEDEAQRAEIKKNLFWKAKVFVFVLIGMATFSSIWAVAKNFI